MRRSLVWIAIISSVGCSRPAAPPADSPATTPAVVPAPPAELPTPEPAAPSVLLTPEASDGAKPQRLDATKPIARREPQPYAWDKTNPERIPELPICKPSQILGDTRMAIREYSTSVAASPDGKWLACGTTLFDLKTGREEFQLRVHEGGQISRAEFSGDSKLLFTQGYNNTFSVWDTISKEHLLTLQTTDWALTPDGGMLATVESVHVPSPVVNGMGDLVERMRPVVRIRDTKTWEETAKFAVHGFRPTAIAIGPDGGTLALGGDDGTVRTWDIAAAKELPKLVELSVDPGKTWHAHYKPAVVRIAFRADGKQLAAANGGVQLVNGECSVVVWEWPSGGFKHRWAGGSLDLCFSPDGKHLVGSGNGTVWNLATGKVEAQLEINRDKHLFNSFDFSPGGDRLFVRGQSPRPQLLEFPSLKPLALLDPPLADAPPKLPFETAGEFQTEKKEIKLRDGTTLRAGPTQRRNSSDWGVEHFDADGKFVRCFDKTRVVGFDVSPDQKRLACYGHQSNGQGNEFPLIFWDIATGEEASRINVYPRPDYWLRYSPDGKWLATLHEDGLVRVWDVAARKPIFALDADGYGGRQVLFSKDGQHLVAGAPGAATLAVWDLREEK